jgi:hypothetical protein
MPDPTKELISQNEVIAVMVAECRTALVSAAVTGRIDLRHSRPPVVSIMETGFRQKS